MKKSRTEAQRTKTKHATKRQPLTEQADYIANRTLRALDNTPYVVGKNGLVVALANWIAEHSDEPVREARTYGSVLETLVEAITDNMAARRGARDVAA